MARQKLLENQLKEGTSWHGFTPKEHFVNLLDWNPVEVIQKITQISDVNLGEDFVSMVMRHGVHYIEPGMDEYTWRLDNIYDTFYEVVGAYEDKAGVNKLGTNVSNPGANRSKFYLDFKGMPFSITETIVGERPDLYLLLVTSEPFLVGGEIWRYEVQLVNHSAEHYIPIEEVEIGTRWSSESGLVTDTLAKDGFDIGFKSNTILNGFLSSFRMRHVIPGNMTTIKPMYFYFKNSKGSVERSWLSNVEWEFIKKAKYATAALIMNGKSNRWADGTYGNYDKNGYAIKAGSGFKEQYSASNKYTFNSSPDLDFMTEIAMDAVAGKVDFSKRKMVVRAGEYGIIELSKAVVRKLGSAALTSLSHLQDTTGRAFKWDNNLIDVNLGQFRSIALINGISFYFMVDPSKDDPRRNKLEHPKGGLASSYEYDIMGFGNVDEKANMQIVRRKGEVPIYGEEVGMRSFTPTGSTSFTNPKQLTTPIDGGVMHYQDFGVGAIIHDPTKIIQYHPEILYK